MVPKQLVIDLGNRGVDHDNPDVEIIHRGKYKSLTKQQCRWLKRRQAVEPAIGDLKSGHRMDRCWLAVATGTRSTRCLRGRLQPELAAARNRASRQQTAVFVHVGVVALAGVYRLAFTIALVDDRRVVLAAAPPGEDAVGLGNCGGGVNFVRPTS